MFRSELSFITDNGLSSAFNISKFGDGFSVHYEHCFRWMEIVRDSFSINELLHSCCVDTDDPEFSRGVAFDDIDGTIVEVEAPIDIVVAFTVCFDCDGLHV